MKTSLVMAVYNGEKYLEEQLDSIRDQTEKLNEVILIDDCSTDNSSILIKQYIIDNKLNDWKLLCNETNLGYRKNFQKGLSIVTGDIVFLCDQDDRWHLDKVKTMIKHMKDERILSLASSFNFMNQNGDLFIVDNQKGKANNNLLLQEINDELTCISLKCLLKMNFSQGCCMAIKKSLIDEYLYYTKAIMPHDWELNMIAAVHNGCYYLDIPLIDYRIHDNNTIGLEDIVDNDIVEEKSKRINQRIMLTKAERDNVAFALTLNLDVKQQKMCQRKYAYLDKRITYMENKNLFSLIIFFFICSYREFGHLKTFLGDAVNIIKKTGEKND